MNYGLNLANSIPAGSLEALEEANRLSWELGDESFNILVIVILLILVILSSGFLLFNQPK